MCQISDKNDIQSLVLELADVLSARGRTVSTAESCTGGGIAAAMTAVAGSSAWFMGGYVTYANQWKMRCLGVKATTLEAHGAVSEETVGEMLTGLLAAGGTDYGAAVSGIAGPGGGTPDKPVGTVYVGVASKEKRVIRRCSFDGDRDAVRRATVVTALSMLIELARQ